MEECIVSKANVDILMKTFGGEEVRDSMGVAAADRRWPFYLRGGCARRNSRHLISHEVNQYYPTCVPPSENGAAWFSKL